MVTINFVCQKCSCKEFDVAAIPEGSDDFTGAICSNCGHAVTDNEVLQFEDKAVEDFADDLLGKMFK